MAREATLSAAEAEALYQASISAYRRMPDTAEREDLRTALIKLRSATVLHLELEDE